MGAQSGRQSKQFLKDFIMWTHTQSNRVLPLDKPFSLEGVSYSANFLRVSSGEDKAAIGLEWIVPEPAPVVRAPIEREKADGIVRAKDTAGKMLAGSDWQIVASVERQRAVPADWAEYRAAVIAEADRLAQQFSTAESYEAIDAIQQLWPEDPDEVAERNRIEAEEAAAKAKREENENAE